MSITRTVKNKILLWLIAAGIVFVACMPQVPSIIPYQDKIGHIGLYALLMIYLGRRFSILSALVALTGIGVFMEFLQSLTVYRSAEMLDIVANTVGLVMGALYIKIRGPVNVSSK